MDAATLRRSRIRRWRPWAIPRPTKWTFLRVMVLGTLGGWLVPLPWQRVTAEAPPPAELVTLGPAARAWVEEQRRAEAHEQRTTFGWTGEGGRWLLSQ